MPIDSRGTQRFAEERPHITADRDRYVYDPGTQMVPTNAAPRVLNRPHTISIEVEVPEGGAEQFFHVRSEGPVPAGHHIVSAEFTPIGPAEIANGMGTPAKVVLFVDGEPVGEGQLSGPTPASRLCPTTSPPSPMAAASGGPLSM